jgi:hypothetical protein
MQLVQKWKDGLIAKDPHGEPVINLSQWLSRMTLDVIGESKVTIPWQ